MVKFLGVTFLIVGMVLEFIRRSNAAKLLSIRSANTTTVQDLLAISQHIAREIGSGNLREYVKVRGQVTCAEPLQSELKHEPCVYYRTSVVRVYEDLAIKTDENGNCHEKLERREERVASNTQMIPFQLDDGTGVLHVDPEGSDIETVQVMSEFRDSHDHGSFTDLRDAPEHPNVTNLPQGGKTLGYRYEEFIVPLGRELLVLGTAIDCGERVMLRKPTEPGKKFLISFQDEEVLVEATLRAVRGAKWGAMICLGFGALLMIVGVVTGR